MKRWALPSMELPALARHRAFLAQRACGQRLIAPATALEGVLRRPIRMVLNRFAFSLKTPFTLRQVSHVHQSLHRAQVHAASVHLNPTAWRTAVRERGGERHSEHRVEQHHLTLRERVQRLREQQQGSVRVEHSVVRRALCNGGYPRLATAVAQPGVLRDGAAARGESANSAAIRGAERNGARSAVSSAPTAWPLPPRDLARLTASVSDEVISQLERRAVALRERSGRW